MGACVGGGMVGKDGSAENDLLVTACHDRDCLQQARMETSQEPVVVPFKNHLFRCLQTLVLDSACIDFICVRLLFSCPDVHYHSIIPDVSSVKLDVP